jgi:CDP-diglyceride synthetase
LPSIWWWLAIGGIAALMVWGWVEVLLSNRLTPVMQLLLLGVIALPLMMSRNWWWHPQRKGVQERAIYVLLLAGLLFAVLGNVLEAALGAQLPRPFLYPCLLAAAGLFLIWYRDPRR